jgi:hypothetical protein
MKIDNFADVMELVDMLDLESSVERRRGSTPLICIASQAGLAQLVEHLICNQRVTGSSPVVGINQKIKILLIRWCF